MPQWGLSTTQRQQKPWDIPEGWLRPGKVITDPVHGDIYLNRLEQAIVDSSPFQRLRRIRQLGTVHLVYPGATHTRFAHALGALRIVQDLLDIILAQRASRHARDDLFKRWEDEGPKNEELERRFAEVIVFARLGALLHDFCHVAYGHSIEDDLKILGAHDENVSRFDDFWSQLGNGGTPVEHKEVQKLMSGRLEAALRVLVLSKERDESNPEKEPLPPDQRLRELGERERGWAYPFVADMVGNTICADLIDYLERDHKFTGLPAALGKRFMSAFYVVPEEKDAAVLYPERMALRIVYKDRERMDVVSELLKYLRFRYELQERAIVHHAKLAADAMLGKMLELWYDAEWTVEAEKHGGVEVQESLKLEPSRDPGVLRDAVVEDTGDAKVAEDIDGEVETRLEERLRQVGDDGLLESLADPPRHLREDHRDKIGLLARDLLDRRLYKRAAQATGALARKRIYERFGHREIRKYLEREAARYAGVEASHVVVWLPDPKMRLKIAEVLVDYESSIAPDNEYSHRGDGIYRDHRQLWTVTVFVHPEVAERKLEPAVLARLAELMEIKWDRHEPKAAKHPAEWPETLVAERALGADAVEEELQEMLKEARQLSHRSADVTFEERVDALAQRAPDVKRRVKRRRQR